MTSLRTLIAAAAILLATATARANQPDSVYLFAYNADPGSGLSLAYSADGHSWQSIANGASFVKSDFAQWGANKKMYTPELTRDANGLWHLTFSVGAATRQYAHATSVDLIHWRPQDYPMAESLEALKQKFAAIEQRQTEAVVNGRRLKGSVNRVAFSHVEALENAKAASVAALMPRRWPTTPHALHASPRLPSTQTSPSMPTAPKPSPTSSSASSSRTSTTAPTAVSMPSCCRIATSNTAPPTTVASATGTPPTRGRSKARAPASPSPPNSLSTPCSSTTPASM